MIERQWLNEQIKRMSQEFLFLYHIVTTMYGQDAEYGLVQQGLSVDFIFRKDADSPIIAALIACDEKGYSLLNLHRVEIAEGQREFMSGHDIMRGILGYPLAPVAKLRHIAAATFTTLACSNEIQVFDDRVHPNRFNGKVSRKATGQILEEKDNLDVREVVRLAATHGIPMSEDFIEHLRGHNEY